MKRTTRSTKTAVIATSIAVSAAVLLTGCGKGSSRPQQTPAPLASAVAPTAGASIAKEQVSKAAEEGLAAFPSKDGKFVAVDPHKPLPQAVVDDVKAGLGDLSKPAADQAGVQKVNAAVYAQLDRINQTGMYGVLIIPSFTYDKAMVATPVVTVVTYAPGFDFKDPKVWIFPDAASARQKVSKTIAAQPDPSSFAVVDATS